MTLDPIRKLSDHELVSSLDGLSREHRSIGAAIIAHLLVVKERHIHLNMSYSSLREYCVERLGCSRDVAYKWAAAVKVAEAHPVVLEWLQAGDITTSAVAALAPFRADAELVMRCRGKSRRQIQLMGAAKNPDGNWNRIQFRSRRLPEGLAKIEMTVPEDFIEQIEEALDLDSRLGARRDPVALLTRALEAYIAGRKRTRREATARPPGHEATEPVPTGPTREAHERASSQCAYVSPQGRRCSARAFLQPEQGAVRERRGANDSMRIYCQNHSKDAADENLGEERRRATRYRSMIMRAIKSTLKRRGFPGRVARNAARAAVEAAGPLASMETLQEEAFRRANGPRRPQRAKPRRRRAQGAPRRSAVRRNRRRSRARGGV